MTITEDAITIEVRLSPAAFAALRADSECPFWAAHHSYDANTGLLEFAAALQRHPARTSATVRAENIAALAAADAACVTTSQHPRQQTVFHLCSGHAWLAGETRERRAEFFGEGGPGFGGPCTPGDSCKIRPGRDLWVAEMCVQRAWYDTATGDHHFRWDVNEAASVAAH